MSVDRKLRVSRVLRRGMKKKERRRRMRNEVIGTNFRAAIQSVASQMAREGDDFWLAKTPKETHMNQLLRIEKSKIRKNFSFGKIYKLKSNVKIFVLLSYSVFYSAKRLTLVLIKIIFLWKNVKRKEIRRNSGKMLLCCFQISRMERIERFDNFE